MSDKPRPDHETVVKLHQLTKDYWSAEYAGAFEKSAAILQEIAGLMNRADIDKLREQLVFDEEVSKGFQDVAQRIADAKQITTEVSKMTDAEVAEEAQKILAKRPRNILDEVRAEVEKITPEEVEAARQRIADFKARRRSVDERNGVDSEERPLKQIRPFVLDIGDSKDPNWSSVREKPIKHLQGATFGFAEETIGFIEYEDGEFLIGIGESLRPFLTLYVGKDAEEASDVFFQAIYNRAYSDSESED